jgi:hypothetical protein
VLHSIAVVINICEKQECVPSTPFYRPAAINTELLAKSFMFDCCTQHLLETHAKLLLEINTEKSYWKTRSRLELMTCVGLKSIDV